MADWKIPECRLLTSFFRGVSMPEFWSAMAMLSNSKQCNSEGLNNSVLIWQARYFLSHLTFSWLQVEAAGPKREADRRFMIVWSRLQKHAHNTHRLPIQHGPKFGPPTLQLVVAKQKCTGFYVDTAKRRHFRHIVKIINYETQLEKWINICIVMLHQLWFECTNLTKALLFCVKHSIFCTVSGVMSSTTSPS